jgi:uncharacterized DUF497 family protein
MAKVLEFDGFQWDDGDRKKCRQHGVSQAEIEGMFERSPGIYDDAGHSGRERRLRAIGPTNTGAGTCSSPSRSGKSAARR